MLQEELLHPPPPLHEGAHPCCARGLSAARAEGMDVCVADLHTAGPGEQIQSSGLGPGSSLTGEAGTIGPLPGVFVISSSQRELETGEN